MRTGDYARMLLRGVAAGAAGTAAMTASGQAYRRIYAWRRGMAPDEVQAVLDYDDSDHVVIAASAVVRAFSGWAPRSTGGRRALFALTHWGYGSAVGAAHAELRHRLGSEPEAGAVFFVGCQTMALSLFPTLGETPPPWRWERRLIVVSLAQHVLYAAAVATAFSALSAAKR